MPYAVVLEGKFSIFYKVVFKFVDLPKLNKMFSLQRIFNKGNLSSVPHVQKNSPKLNLHDFQAKRKLGSALTCGIKFCS